VFFLDSLMIAGIRWTLETIVTAADAEMNDDTALREQLLASEMRRETGEITDAQFADIERDLLARIREIRDRREGGSGPLAFGVTSPGDGASRLAVEASVEGEFHTDRPEPPDRSDLSEMPAARTTRTTRTPRTARAVGATRKRRGTRTARVRTQKP
jgi:hypothetical protein